MNRKILRKSLVERVGSFKWVLAVLLFAGVVNLYCYDSMFYTPSESPHPIDQEFEGKLDFLGTNLEMSINISKAQEAWFKEMKIQEQRITADLPAERAESFRQTQRKWKESWEADRVFFVHQFKDLRYVIGREGELGVHLDFMERVRERVLLLTDFHTVHGYTDAPDAE